MFGTFAVYQSRALFGAHAVILVSAVWYQQLALELGQVEDYLTHVKDEHLLHDVRCQFAVECLLEATCKDVASWVGEFHSGSVCVIVFLPILGVYLAGNLAQVVERCVFDRMVEVLCVLPLLAECLVGKVHDVILMLQVYRVCFTL